MSEKNNVHTALHAHQITTTTQLSSGNFRNYSKMLVPLFCPILFHNSISFRNNISINSWNIARAKPAFTKYFAGLIIHTYNRLHLFIPYFHKFLISRYKFRSSLPFTFVFQMHVFNICLIYQICSQASYSKALMKAKLIWFIIEHSVKYTFMTP